MTKTLEPVPFDHDRVRELIEAYIDGRLDEPQQSAVRSHLEQCDACSEYFARAVDLEDRIRTALLGDLPSVELSTAIQHSLAAKGRKPAAVRAQGAWMPSIRVVAAAALILGLLIAGLPAARLVPHESRIASEAVAQTPVRELRDWVASGRPLDVGESDPRRLRAWFERRVNFTLPMPPGANGDLTLNGGRLCHFFDRAVASYMYEFERHIVSIYVMSAEGLDMPPDASTGVTIGDGDYSNVIVTRGGLVIAIVSDLSPDARRRLERQLRSLTSGAA
ncbi:MAG: zf-HC2 domain-containing protein [Hyphomicrobium sp.]|jgi:anti-sigma factor RsiW